MTGTKPNEMPEEIFVDRKDKNNVNLQVALHHALRCVTEVLGYNLATGRFHHQMHDVLKLAEKTLKEYPESDVINNEPELKRLK